MNDPHLRIAAKQRLDHARLSPVREDGGDDDRTRNRPKQDAVCRPQRRRHEKGPMNVESMRPFFDLTAMSLNRTPFF